MSQRKKDQVTAMYVFVLALFGGGLIVSTLILFCWLSGPDVTSCLIDAVNPF